MVSADTIFKESADSLLLSPDLQAALFHQAFKECGVPCVRMLEDLPCHEGRDEGPLSNAELCAEPGQRPPQNRRQSFGHVTTTLHTVVGNVTGAGGKLFGVVGAWML